ncbi:MAG TPA: bifunctional acetate--CoA ligase family protein/GNAT family N-acetyltransferase [Pseudolabrys sp.]|nr:bifunctional acetate--CoA ligase family protein/GNAT family N-acetyltransferase [Pseudolabrys sp.]
MSTYRLDRLLAPQSVVLIGGSPRETSVGRHILRNLRAGGFDGVIGLVNPKYREIEGVVAAKHLGDLQSAPDLAIIAVPPRAVPEVISEAGAKGCAAAIVITSGLGSGSGSIAESARLTARQYGLRLLGPNCLGVLVPRSKLNASFAVRLPRAGDLALISQSGAIAAGLAEWAAQRDIGFSAIVSLGDQIDVDFGDLLDFFALDRGTRAILLYVESINDARKFMSAARAAARTKPVVVVKAGRHAQGAKAAATHTGALAGSDAVYDAAFRRAGLVRVRDLDELFAAVETIAHVQPFSGRRLAILTNGGGIGVLAVDRLADFAGTLSALSSEAYARLDRSLPPIWSRANPVDIAGDADPERYQRALEVLVEDKENDAILVMNVPTALASSTEAARSVIAVAERIRSKTLQPKPILAVWVGEDAAASQAFDAAGIPHFANESDAVESFMHLVSYREGLDLLMQTPPSLPEQFTADSALARQIVRQVLKDGRAWLDPLEVVRLFAAYDIPITPAAFASNPEEAVSQAKTFFEAGNTVAVKILSRDIVHKSEVDGVRLNLTTENAVREAAVDVLARARSARPDARISGLSVHPMIVRPKAHELIAGIADDPTFGPVIVFGAGGTAVEVLNDKALALPPLDLNMAAQLIDRTRIAQLLKGYRNVPPTNRDAVALVLIKLAQLAADLPEVRELDINPLLADDKGVMALDARVAVAQFESAGRGERGHPRFAVRPYPKEWEQRFALRDGTPVFIRPIRPEDARLYERFLEATTEEDLRLRFFAQVKDLSHVYIARLTQIDYARAMAFVALGQQSGDLLGVARLHTDANYETAEFAVLVRSDLKGRGLGWLLMQRIVEYARAEGLSTLQGQVLAENATMLTMCRELGFEVAPDPHDLAMYAVRLSLK